MALLFLVDSGQRIEIRRQPAVVFGEQLGDEFRWRVRVRSNQVMPTGLSLASSGHLHASSANKNVVSIEIKVGNSRQEFFKTYGLREGISGLRIDSRQRPVQARHRGTIQD